MWADNTAMWDDVDADGSITISMQGRKFRCMSWAVLEPLQLIGRSAREVRVGRTCEL